MRIELKVASKWAFWRGKEAVLTIEENDSICCDNLHVGKHTTMTFNGGTLTMNGLIYNENCNGTFTENKVKIKEE